MSDALEVQKLTNNLTLGRVRSKEGFPKKIIHKTFETIREEDCTLGQKSMKF